MKKVLIYIVITIIFSAIVIFFLMFHPVNNSRANSIEITGKVVEIFEGGVKDACFYLEGDKSCYYINRGLENGLRLSDLQEKLTNETVKIYYADYWSLFNIAEYSKHVNQIELNDSIIYTEW